MTCAGATSLMEAYVDGELDAGEKAQVAEHLAACSACGAAYARLAELRDGIRAHAPYYGAPPGFEDRVRLGLRQAGRESATAWRWLAVAAGILLAVSAAWNVTLLRSRSAADPVAADILSSHVRSLIGTHLLDVPSSDQHTVKPWFNGKLDFSPDVRDLAAQGFPLIGGRVDYAGHRTVAALVFERRKHTINLFTWPSSSAGADGGPSSERSANGYHVLHWNQAGMAWWAVSDLNAAELRQFESLYRSALDTAP